MTNDNDQSLAYTPLIRIGISLYHSPYRQGNYLNIEPKRPIFYIPDVMVYSGFGSYPIKLFIINITAKTFNLCPASNTRFYPVPQFYFVYKFTILTIKANCVRSWPNNRHIPIRTLKNWGNSSILVFLNIFPNLVIRESPLNVGL